LQVETWCSAKGGLEEYAAAATATSPTGHQTAPLGCSILSIYFLHLDVPSKPPLAPSRAAALDCGLCSPRCALLRLVLLAAHHWHQQDTFTLFGMQNRASPRAPGRPCKSILALHHLLQAYFARPNLLNPTTTPDSPSIIYKGPIYQASDREVRSPEGGGGRCERASSETPGWDRTASIKGTMTPRPTECGTLPPKRDTMPYSECQIGPSVSCCLQ
jgi:hypothetical protein